MTTEQVFNITTEIAKNNKEIRTRGFKIENTDSAIFEEVLRDLSNDLKNVVAKLTISTRGKEKVQSFLDQLIKMGTNSTKPSYSDIYSYVVKFEKEIQINKDLTENDKLAILCGTSIARYSGKLWSDKSESSSYATKSDGRKWWGHVLVVGADVVGGVIGGGTKNPGQAASTGGSFSSATDKYLDDHNK